MNESREAIGLFHGNLRGVDNRGIVPLAAKISFADYRLFYRALLLDAFAWRFCF